MLRTSSLLSTIFLVVAITSGSHAQETTDQAVDAQDTAPAVPELQGGEIVQAEPVVEVIGDWTVVCNQTDFGLNCLMQQRLLNEERNPLATIEVWPIGSDSEFAAGAVIALPLGVMLEEGIILQVDSSLPRRYRFVVCQADGCFSRFGLSSNELSGMKSGNQMAMTVYAFSNPDQAIDLAFSLSGFTAAFERIQNPDEG